MIAMRRHWNLMIAVCSLLPIGGCCRDHCRAGAPFQPVPLGTLSDSVWQKQEENAEASDFVIHEHEFIGNTARLNKAGEEHIKQIAARSWGAPFPIIVERNSMSLPGDRANEFPVHGDEQLDARRRALIVNALVTLGVGDADARVVVGPALTPGFEQFEAERAYSRGFGGQQNNSFGRGFGGFGNFNP